MLQVEIGLACVDALLHLVVVVLKLKQVNDRAGQHCRVARILYLDLAHHLTHNNLDMLVVDVYALLTVNLLNFLDLVIVHRTRVKNAQNIMRAERAFVELLTLLDNVAALHTDTGRRSELIRTNIAIFRIRDVDGLEGRALGLLDGDNARNLGQCCNLLGFTRLEQFLNSRKTLRNIRTCNAAGMEGTHGKLGTRLTDGLRCDDTNCLTHAAGSTCCKVHAVAVRTNALACAAFEYRTNLQAFDAGCNNLVCLVVLHHSVLGNEQFAGFRMEYIIHRITASRRSRKPSII